MHYKAWLLFLFPILTFLYAKASPTLDSLSPTPVSAGQTFSIIGSDFDPDKTYTASVGDEELTVVGTTPTELQVQAGSQSGLLQVVEDGVEVTSDLYVSVVTSVLGQLVAPPGVNVDGYQVMNGDSTTAVASDGTFSIPVSADRTTVLWAFRDDADPVFFAVHLPGDSSVLIDSASTAITSVFLSPLLTTRNAELAQQRVDAIAASEETDELAAFIEVAAADSRDHQQDGRFDELYLAALESSLTEISQLVPTQSTLTAPLRLSRRTNEPNLPIIIKSLNRDEIPNSPESDGAMSWMKLTAELKGDRSNGSDYYLVSLVNKQSRPLQTDNPLTWMFSVYEINPNRFNDRQAVADFDQSDSVFQFVEPGFSPNPAVGPIYQGSVDADLGAADVDVGELLVNAVFSQFESAVANDHQLITGAKPTFTPAKNQFLLPGDREGIYVIQAFSGNLAFGYEYWDDPGSVSQIRILEAQDRLSQWETALALNIVILSVDLLSIANLPDHFGDIASEIFVDVSQLLTAEFAQQKELNAQLMYVVLRQTVISALEATLKTKSASLTDAIFAGTKLFGKSLVKFFDITSKVSAFAEFGQRTNGLLLKQAFATERFLLIVGNPFKPKISNYSPRSGRAGDVVNITGYNFPANPKVSFCRNPQTTTNDSDPAFDSKAEATILRSNETSISVTVPENWEGELGSGNFDAFICIEEDGEDHIATTQGRIDIPESFFFIPRPVITSVFPDPIYPGSTVTINAEHLTGLNPELYRILIDDSPSGDVINSSGLSVTFELPDTIQTGFHNLKVRIEPNPNYTSDSFSFVVSPRPEDNRDRGFQISVSTDSDSSTISDGVVSLREAILILRGERGFQQRPDGVEGGQFESDFISETIGRFAIEAHEDIESETITLNSPLPDLPLGTQLSLDDVTINATNAGDPTFDIRNNLDTSLSGFAIEDAPGIGINIQNSELVTVSKVTVRNSGGTGIKVTDSPSVRINGAIIESPGAHGIHLTGPLTRGAIVKPGVFINPNPFGRVLNATSGYGVLVDNGVKDSRIDPGDVRNCSMGGICVTGNSTDGIVVGDATFVRPALRAIVDNGGHGVHIKDGADRAIVRWLLTAGNSGDGIRIDGGSGHRVDSVFSGIDIYDTSPSADTYGFPRARAFNPNQNTGHGVAFIDVSDSIIGGNFPAHAIRGFGERFGLLNNGKSGIYLQDSNDVTVASGHLGDVFSLDFDGTLLSPAPVIPNGENGIHIKGGGQHTIGEFHSFYDLHINGAPNGAGVLIENSDGNQVIGNQIGIDHGFIFTDSNHRLRYGVHIKGTSRNNRIGELGSFFEIPFLPGDSPPFTGPYRPYNVISNCLVAGVFIENAGGNPDFGNPALAERPNIVQNNFIGEDEFQFSEFGNAVGILIEGSSFVNVIGGPTNAHGNTIRYNDDAGIRFEDFSVADLEDRLPFRVRIGGNTIIDQGKNNQDPVQPLLEGFPGGAGIHVHNCRGCVISSLPLATNVIESNNVGIYVENSEHGIIGQQTIKDNREAGIVLRASDNNRLAVEKLGARTTVELNGQQPVTQTGGIILADSNNNRLSDIDITSNSGPGLHLHDSANNLIGTVNTRSLKINQNTGDGILVEGGGSNGNQINGFIVGIDGLNPAGNQANGIHFSDGAHSNQVGTAGGSFRIGFNNGAGVLVDGSSTVGNSINRTAIYQNATGITHQGGGNRDQVAPLISTVSPSAREITGLVANTTTIPAGSTIEAFIDSASPPQGRRLLGRTTTTPGGEWTLFAPALGVVTGNVTVTATNATTNDTSEFSTEFGIARGFSIERTDSDAPSTRTFSKSRPSLILDRYTVSTINAPVTMLSVDVNLSGTIDDSQVFQQIEIWLDADENGLVSDADILLGSEDIITDDGSISIEFAEHFLGENTSEFWLLNSVFKSEPNEGTTVTASVVAASDVIIDTPSQQSTLAIIGSFPLDGDTHEATSSDLYSTFQQDEFGPDANNPLIAGRLVDTDFDNVINIFELIRGLDPQTADNGTFLEGMVINGFYQFEYDRKSGIASGFSLLPELSSDLIYWFNDPNQIDEIRVTDNGDGTEKVTIVTAIPDSTALRLFCRIRVAEL
ncbi:MAG: right-handed parallel beta-helix repeat-containing protein [Verrucomicrobiota bacterium]